MSETKVNVNNVTDLQMLGEAVKDLPAKDIAQVLLKELCHQESDVGLYERLFTNIIHHFEPKEFEAEVSCALWPELIIFLDKIQNELQTNGLSYFFVENLTTLLRLADVLQKLVEYIAEKAKQCQLYRSLIIFPEYLLRCYTIVRQNYVSMAKETEALEAMKALYTVCKKILIAFLELLCPRDATSRGTYFRAMENDEEYECLAKVCTVLANVGNEISPIDSLLASDVWKAIVKLSTEHADQFFTRNRTSWLIQIISILNTGIDTSLRDIRIKNEPSKQAIIALKLNAFFLRVMLKLLSLSKQHTSPDVFQPIVGTLLQIKTCLTSSTVCGELAAGIDQYLHVGYMAIVENTFRTEAFAKELCQHKCATIEEIHSFYALLFHVVEQLVSNANDSHLVSIYCYRQNLLGHVCTLLTRSDSLLFHDSSMYKQLLTHLSALILLGARLRNRDAQKAIEETLVRMVLQEHYYTGLLAIDLWSVFVRYHSSRLLYGYFMFWKKVNDQYSIFKTRPEQVFLKQLLQNLWIFLPVTHKVKVLDMYPVSANTNDRLWTTVGLVGEIDAIREKQFAESVGKRLQIGIHLLQQQLSVHDFYEVLGLLLIADKMIQSNGNLEESINSFWNSISDWSIVWKTTLASTIFGCLEKNPESIPKSIFHPSNIPALSDASVLVKCVMVELIDRIGYSVHVSPFIEPLLNDDCPFIAALALKLLNKLNNKQHPVAYGLLAKSHHLQSQLSNVRKRHPLPKLSGKLSVIHRCKGSYVSIESQSCGNLTLIINSRIDELFPNDDDDEDDKDIIDDLDTDMFTANVSEPKKRKVELIGNDIGLSLLDCCLSELEAQGKRLEEQVQSQTLQEAQKGRLKIIISSLSKALDS